MPKFIKLCQNVNFLKSRSSLKLDPVGLKRRSRGQIIEKIHVHFRGHSFDPKFMKLCQNVSHHKI